MGFILGDLYLAQEFIVGVSFASELLGTRTMDEGGTQNHYDALFIEHAGGDGD